MWVVYNNPRDYPGWFVARKFTTRKAKPVPTRTVLKAKTLKALRAKMPPNLTYLDRHELDDPKIVGTWI